MANGEITNRILSAIESSFGKEISELGSSLALMLAIKYNIYECTENTDTLIVNKLGESICKSVDEYCDNYYNENGELFCGTVASLLAYIGINAALKPISLINGSVKAICRYSINDDGKLTFSITTIEEDDYKQYREDIKSKEELGFEYPHKIGADNKSNSGDLLSSMANLAISS